jgi:hypothetical protein
MDKRLVTDTAMASQFLAQPIVLTPTETKQVAGGFCLGGMAAWVAQYHSAERINFATGSTVVGNP